MERMLAIGGAVIIACVAGSIENCAIAFAGAAVVTLGYWLLLTKVFP